MGTPNPIKIGEVFDRLTVIGESARRGKNGQKYFICYCICGNTKEVRGTSLKNRDVKSCGCLYKETVGKVCRLEPKEVSYNEIERRYKNGAKNRSYEYSLSKEEFLSLVSNNCHYCDTLPVPYNKFFKKDGIRINSHYTISNEWAMQQWINVNGIDRKDNNAGYIFENCVSCCETCNKMKLDMSYEEFLNHIDKISKHKNI